jgi:hypothetical protein
VHPFPSSGDSPARDVWFDVLDQRRFTVGHEQWTAQVSGIHVIGAHTWIQLEFAEDQRRSLLLQLAPGTGVGAAVELIHDSLRRRASSDS